MLELEWGDPLHFEQHIDWVGDVKILFETQRATNERDGDYCGNGSNQHPEETEKS